MATRNRHPRRGVGCESPGSVDSPFDADPQASRAPGLASDAACSVAWRADGFEAIQVFVDAALRDRADEICETIEGISGAHGDIDTLSDALVTYAGREGLSASIHERPPDDLSSGVLAVALTLG